jgi:protein-tyrosine phosphatase
MRQPVSVLFVCMGDICRSPMAEGVFRHLAEPAGPAGPFDIAAAALKAK